MSTSAGVPELVAADSFRVRVCDGRAEVRGFERHIARFRWAVSDATAAGESLSAQAISAADAFLAEAISEIARFGEGFPRLEMWRTPDGSTRFALSLRPLPPLGEALQLTSVVAAPSARARRKGPNIASYSALNRKLSAEAVLVDATGFVREGATTSLICWPDKSDETGYVIDSDARVASVTEAILVAAAAQRLLGKKPNSPRA
ncbi:MAG: hypothetical protein KA158_11175, partial [Leucobacter sp.]|nr:hypothetical protein [Leucobacter sp.]